MGLHQGQVNQAAHAGQILLFLGHQLLLNWVSSTQVLPVGTNTLLQLPPSDRPTSLGSFSFYTK